MFKGRGPPRKEMSLPGQRARGSGREVKLPASCQGLLRASSPAGLLRARLHIRCFLGRWSPCPSVSPRVTWNRSNAFGCFLRLEGSAEHKSTFRINLRLPQRAPGPRGILGWPRFIPRSVALLYTLCLS